MTVTNKTNSKQQPISNFGYPFICNCKKMYKRCLSHLGKRTTATAASNSSTSATTAEGFLHRCVLSNQQQQPQLTTKRGIHVSPVLRQLDEEEVKCRVHSLVRAYRSHGHVSVWRIKQFFCDLLLFYDFTKLITINLLNENPIDWSRFGSVEFAGTKEGIRSRVETERVQFECWGWLSNDQCGSNCSHWTKV